MSLDPISPFTSTWSFQPPGKQFYPAVPTFLDALASPKVFCFHLLSIIFLAIPVRNSKVLSPDFSSSQAQPVFKSSIFSLLQITPLFCCLLHLFKFYFSKIFPRLFQKLVFPSSSLANPSWILLTHSSVTHLNAQEFQLKASQSVCASLSSYIHTHWTLRFHIVI